MATPFLCFYAAPFFILLPPKQSNMEKEKYLYNIFNQFDPSTPIFKYMDIDYFLYLIEEKKFFVSFKKNFLDAQESNLLQPNRCGSYIFPVQICGKESSEEEKEQNHKMVDKMFKSFKESTLLPTSCWTLTKEENYLMWKSYTSRLGVRIETTIEKFVCALDTEGYKIIGGKMEYEGFCYPNVVEKNWFLKAPCYAGENEIRFYFYPTEGITEEYEKRVSKMKGERFEINDYHRLITKIILSPFINEKAANTIKNLMEKYEIQTKISRIVIG